MNWMFSNTWSVCYPLSSQQQWFSQIWEIVFKGDPKLYGEAAFAVTPEIEEKIPKYQILPMMSVAGETLQFPAEH